MTQALSTSKHNPWLDIRSSIGITMIDHLFNRLDGIYTGKWQQAFKTPASIENWKSAWAESLHDRGITPEQIKRGLKNCVDLYDWPPSLSEFVKACEQKSRDEQITPIEDPSKLLAHDIKPDPAKAAAVAKMSKSLLSGEPNQDWANKILDNQRGHSVGVVKMAQMAARRKGLFA
ncbi:replication protein P [Advenella sp. EE-W14]|uniref:replication protein P n=1 Tax=Advenella sp. EE-W14 TaxID=2722705 RepID=UPI00145DB0A6|nr:replication protein P [Advenella sp. EE-W14]